MTKRQHLILMILNGIFVITNAIFVVLGTYYSEINLFAGMFCLIGFTIALSNYINTEEKEK
jgi:hypothetical protein